MCCHVPGRLVTPRARGWLLAAALITLQMPAVNQRRGWSVTRNSIRSIQEVPSLSSAVAQANPTKHLMETNVKIQFLLTLEVCPSGVFWLDEDSAIYYPTYTLYFLLYWEFKGLTCYSNNNAWSYSPIGVLLFTISLNVCINWKCMLAPTLN